VEEEEAGDVGDGVIVRDAKGEDDLRQSDLAGLSFQDCLPLPLSLA